VYKLTLIARYLWKRRITHFAVVAVALCVFTVVVVMTVMAGLVGDFKEKNHAFTGDCVVATESLVGFPYFEEFMTLVEQTGLAAGISPVVKSYALLGLEGGYEDDVEIVGLDPVRHSRATNFGATLSFRRNDVQEAFVPMYDPNLPGCVLGIDRAMQRDARGQYPKFSGPFMRSVTLTCFPLTAKGALFKASTGLVSTMSFYYSDNSHTGIARVDDGYVYVPLEQAQWLCMGPSEIKRITSLHIKFRPGVGEAEGCRRIAELWDQFKQDKADAIYGNLLENVSVQGWKEYRRAVIAPMEQEQLILSLMFVLVGITTVFIVFVVFYMIVNSKRKDIGILKSAGASSVGVLSLFQGFAFSIGLLGSCAGILFAWLFLSRINQIEQWSYKHLGIQLWDRTIYVIGDIPNHVGLSMLAVIVLFALLACQVGALVPSYLAVRLRPVETLHAGRM
jgi:ABC-type lipoprotein release transport system permease subunit